MQDITLFWLTYNLRFDHLVTFKAIVQCGSFKGAAERLLISQPAISDRIKQMEGAFGARLFDRGRGSLPTMTPLGQRLLVLADSVLDDLRVFQQDLERIAEPLSGSIVTIAAGPSFIKYRLLSAVQGFREKHPEIDLKMSHSQSLPDILSAVTEGDAEIGIYPASPPAHQVARFPLGREKLVLAAPPEHSVLREPVDRRTKALEGVPLAVSSYAANSRQLLETWAAHHDVRLRISIEADNLDTLKEAALQGVALAFVPGFAVEDEVSDGRLATVDAPGLPIERGVWIIVHAGSPPTTATRLFTQYLTGYIRQRDGSDRRLLEASRDS